MGLAAYGEPERLEAFSDIVRFDKNGNGNGFRLGLEYFVHHRTGPEMSWAEADKTPALGKLFSEEMARRLGAARLQEEPLEQRHRNLATPPNSGRAAGAAPPEFGGVAASAAGRGLSGDAGEVGEGDWAQIDLPGRRSGVQLRGERENF